MTFQRIVTAGVVAGCFAVPATAQTEYPDGPVNVVVHTAPGGGTDVMARTLFRHLEEQTGETFVVENHPGAGGQIGYTRLATSEPDGYTVGAITTLSIVTHELTREGVTYSFAEDFQPVARIVLDPSVVVVAADSPYESLEDLIAAAEESPGDITWGGTFLYGAHHIHYILFNRETGAELQYVPFDGAADSRAALLGGHIDVAAGGFSEFGPLIDEGEVRILASAGNERWETYPDVPTYTDLGHDIVIGSNRGFAVPAGTPEDRVEWLETQIAEVMESEAFREEAEQVDIAASLSYMPGDEFREYLLELQDTMRDVLPEDSLVGN